MAHKPTSCLARPPGSQAQRGTSSRVATHRCPTPPLSSTTQAHRIHLVYSSVLFSLILTQKRRCTRLSRCAFYLDHYQARSLRWFLPMPHRFQVSKLFPWPPLSRYSWLLPDPSCFAFPSLSRFLALSDPLVLCYLDGRCGLRRAAQG